MNNKKGIILTVFVFLLIIGLYIAVKFFSEENQNAFNRSYQTTIGLKNGKVEVYVGQSSPVRRFFNVEKLSTATATNGNTARTYRYGFGYIDMDKDNKLSKVEKQRGKKYFELSEFSQYIYFDATK